MKSEDSNSEEKKSDDEVLLPQVVDYYKKYSQSRKLPSYLRGSIVDKIDECIPEKEAETSRVESPGSSVASKSKLEWDNGADIGYENAEGQKADSGAQEEQVDKIMDPTTSESSCNVDSDMEKPVKFPDSLKKKIGVPIAESTPDIKGTDFKYVETPKRSDLKLNTKRSSSYEELSSSRSEKALKKWTSQQDVIDVDRVVESRCIPLKKLINLHPTKPTVIECISKKSKRDKDTQTSLKRNTSAAVQTDVEAGKLEENQVSHPSASDSEAYVSKCHSFEYLYGENYSQDELALKRTEAKTDLGQGDGQGDSSSGKSSFVLGDILAKKYSRHLNKDIDYTISLIQKLANSKRYDDVTKRYYLRKIVEKIVNNCYSDDSSGSQMKQRDRNEEEEQYLQGNMPWKPVDSTKKAELTKQTFVNEFVPTETKKKSPFTLCHDKHSREIIHSSSGDCPNTSDSANWREQKTLSERLFEQQQKSSSSDSVGDSLVNFAKKERQNQLTWINNEIAHLNKLKKLLDDRKRATIPSSVLNPRVEDFPARKKSTTVYMITTEKSDDNMASSSNSSATATKSCKCPANQQHKTPCMCITKVPNAPVDLTNARLVSNEVFTTNSTKGRTTTSVSRYCFEIPLEESGAVIKNMNNTQIPGKSPCKCCCITRTVARTEFGMIACPATSDMEIQSQVSQNDKIIATERTKTTDKQSKTDNSAIRLAASQTETKEVCPICGCSLQKDKRCSCTQTSEQKPRTANAATSHDKKCSCKECQCNEMADSATQHKSGRESATQHLDSVDKISRASGDDDSKRKNSTQTSSKTSVNSGTQHSSSENSNCQTIKISLSEASTTTSSSSSSSEFRLCPCCRLNKVALPSDRSVRDSKPSTAYILCYPCYQQCEKTTKPGSKPFYTYPGHVCNCYTVLKTSALEQIRRTIKDLEKLDAKEDYCKCVISKSKKKNKDYCKYCNCRLQKVRKGKTGIAYTLTLESTPPKPGSPKDAKTLPEIKIKVPDTRSRKKRKDEENEQKAKCDCDKKSKKEKNSTETVCMTLQEYLSMNNPGFVQSAEERRKCLLELAVMREERCNKYKQLLALSSGMPTNESRNNSSKYPRFLCYFY